jgi:hypothetical protein
MNAQQFWISGSEQAASMIFLGATSAGRLRLDLRKLIPSTFGQQHGRSRFLMQSRPAEA